MRALIARSLVAAALAATAALVSVMVLYDLAPGVTLDMTHAVPSIVGGIYPPERDPSGMPFAWTSGRVEIRLPGLDRRTPWTLTISARAARPDAAMFPRLRVAVDGNVLSTDQLANEPSTIEVTVPSRASAAHDTTIEVTLDQTFVPGNGDARELGAVVTRIALEPVGTAIPPAGLLVGGPLAAASFGAAFALTGLPTLAATAVGAVVALGYAAVVTSGFGAYGSYGLDAAWMAVLIAFGTLGIVGLVRQRTALSQAAIAVAAISAGALYLKLIVLLHPAMPVGDALFHAHRFQWVLEGRYYFTSIAPGLYEFPYPVGFYLLASPLVLFTQSAEQYTTLIRVAGTVAQVGAALALYSMVVRAWGDRMVGATAVGMFHLLPLTMGVLGTGNWTNAFAESVAILSLAAVTTAPLRRLSLPVAMGTIAIIALACLSHTSTFAILPTTVILTALLSGGRETMRLEQWPGRSSSLHLRRLRRPCSSTTGTSATSIVSSSDASPVRSGSQARRHRIRTRKQWRVG